MSRRWLAWTFFQSVEAVLVVLRDVGCPPDESVHLLRAFVATLIGTLLREVNAGPTYGTTDTAGIARRQSILENSGLPAVATAAQHLARFDGAAEYEFAMSLALDALPARLANRSGSVSDYPLWLARPTAIQADCGDESGATGHQVGRGGAVRLA
ncbi:hypothetical protein AB0M45_22795 [Nocardia sp. NPDC051787]|uniref:hypothetical protein n=1 Tax=Nocardia sp. NPDC051787 TaxID=3155415 RepID=UPI003433D87E